MVDRRSAEKGEKRMSYGIRGKNTEEVERNVRKGGIKKMNEFKLHSSFTRKSLHKESKHKNIQIKRTE